MKIFGFLFAVGMLLYALTRVFRASQNTATTQLRHERQNALLGDLAEGFYRRARRDGLGAARIWYLRQVVCSVDTLFLALSGLLRTIILALYEMLRKDKQGSPLVVKQQETSPPVDRNPRNLKTTVEASIYCDVPVAAPIHRSVAAILDVAMIFIGWGIFMCVVQIFGVTLRLDRFNVAIFACTLIMVALFYGFLFALIGRETPGQNWTELRLINFDGFPPDGTSRFLRFSGCWLSFCACGIGLLWSLLDEEKLTWHDHMSKTFPTMREGYFMQQQ